MGALLEIRGQLRNLQWYGEVNRRGFVKITKKLDKKIPENVTQQRYLATKVDPKAFATNFRLSQDLRAVNDWLSKVGDVKITDDASSVASGASLKRVSSQSILCLPPGLLDTVDQAIKNDDSALLAELLLEANTDGDEKGAVFQRLLLNLLQRSISCRSKRCIDNLLQQIHTLEEDGDVNKRNCLHRLVIAISRAKINESKQHDNSSNSSWLEATRYIQPAEHQV
jgi:glycerophosphodiester phosphodiesterase